MMERLLGLVPPEKREDMIGAYDFSAFQRAAQEGRLEVMERLINLAPDKVQDMISANDYYAFQEAAFNGHVRVIERLSELVAPEALEDMISANDFNAFSNAAEAEEGSLDIIEKLMQLLPHQVENMISADDFLAFSRAAEAGNLDVMERLLVSLPEKAQAMVSANEFRAFRWAAKTLQYQEICEKLLHYPSVFAYAEMHGHEYGEIVRFFRNRHLKSLAQEINAFKLTNPDAIFDITNLEQVHLYFYMMKNCIRDASAESMQQLKILLSIPTVRTMAHQAISGHESNELLHLALSLNHHDATEILMEIPEVRDLAKENNFYQEANYNLDLAGIAQAVEEKRNPAQREDLRAARERFFEQKAENSAASVQEEPKGLKRLMSHT